MLTVATKWLLHVLGRFCGDSALSLIWVYTPLSKPNFLMVLFYKDWLPESKYGKGSVQDNSHTDRIMIFVFLGVKALWYSCGFTMRKYLLMATRVIVNRETHANEAIAKPCSWQMNSPNVRSPAMRTDRQGGAQIDAIRMSAKASETTKRFGMVRRFLFL